jgi:hypothetical protein
VNSASSVAIAIAVVAAIQSVLAVWLDRLPIMRDSFRKVLVDRAKTYELFGIKDFFGDLNLGSDRVDSVVDIGMLSARVTAQLSALVGTLAGSIVLTVFVFLSSKSLGWRLGATASSILVLFALVKLANRIRTGVLRDFRLKRSMGGSIWNTPGPYVAVGFVTAIFVAVAGVLL